MKHLAPIVLMLGTDPESRAGGIAAALPGVLESARRAGYRVFMIPTHHPRRLGGRTLWWVRGLVELFRRRLAAGSAPLVVHAHAGAGLSLVRKATLLWVARRLGARTALQLHAAQAAGYVAGPAWQRAAFLQCLRPAHVLVVLGPWWRRLFEAQGLPQPIAVVPNVLRDIDFPEDVDPPVREGPAAELTLLSLTRLKPGKGVDKAIAALALVERARLIVAGRGRQEAELRALVGDLGLGDRVRFAGWVDSEGRRQLLREADLFFLPSRSDSFGMVFVEAMAAGRPVVALDVGPVADVVRHGETGFLASSDDPETLAAALEWFRDPRRRREVGRRARQWTEESFSVPVVAQRLDALYRRLLGNDAP